MTAGILVPVAAFLVAAAVSMLLFPVLIGRLLELKAGQVIQDELPDSHQKKAGTPTAGGILFVLLGLLAGAIGLIGRQPGTIPPALALLGGGALGFADDLVKLREGWLGIPARFKFPVQIALAVPLAFVATHGTHQWLLGGLPEPAMVTLAVIAIAGTANAVNLTDGMDGLAGSLALIALLAVLFVLPHALAGEQIVGGALCGALAGFLVFNRYPARVFMGDTGSLGLGFVLATMAIEQGWLLLLPLLGLVFVIETLSVIIQVGYFKATRGRRIFKMTPIHYTFRLEGWSENRIVLTFSVVALLTALTSAWLIRLW